jgi:hypothetical protein
MTLLLRAKDAFLTELYFGDSTPQPASMYSAFQYHHTAFKATFIVIQIFFGFISFVISFLFFVYLWKHLCKVTLPSVNCKMT